MRRDTDYYVNEFVQGLLEQDEAIDQDRERAYVRKQEKRFSRAVDVLRQSEEGVQALAKVLKHESPRVAIAAAVYLLVTSAEAEAVDTLRKYANRPGDDLYTYAARERLKEWKKQKAQKR